MRTSCCIFPLPTGGESLSPSPQAGHSTELALPQDALMAFLETAGSSSLAKQIMQALLP